MSKSLLQQLIFWWQRIISPCQGCNGYGTYTDRSIFTLGWKEMSCPCCNGTGIESEEN